MFFVAICNINKIVDITNTVAKNSKENPEIYHGVLLITLFGFFISMTLQTYVVWGNKFILVEIGYIAMLLTNLPRTLLTIEKEFPQDSFKLKLIFFGFLGIIIIHIIISFFFSRY